MSFYTLHKSYEISVPDSAWSSIQADLSFFPEEWSPEDGKGFSHFIETSGFAKKIASGSSRRVFLSDGMSRTFGYLVLKVAINLSGFAQNGREVEIFLRTADFSDILPRIIAWDAARPGSRQAMWILCERATPIKGEMHFIEVAKFPFPVLNYFIHVVMARKNDTGYIESVFKAVFNKDHSFFRDSLVVPPPYDDSYTGVADFFEPRFVMFLKRLYKIWKQNKNFLLSDLGGGYDNWGVVRRNGHPTLVVIDSGLTVSVWNDYYDPFKDLIGGII